MVRGYRLGVDSYYLWSGCKLGWRWMFSRAKASFVTPNPALCYLMTVASLTYGIKIDKVTTKIGKALHRELTHPNEIRPCSIRL